MNQETASPSCMHCIHSYTTCELHDDPEDIFMYDDVGELYEVFCYKKDDYVLINSCDRCLEYTTIEFVR